MPLRKESIMDQKENKEESNSSLLFKSFHKRNLMFMNIGKRKNSSRQSSMERKT
jgi:hypothetical protein